MREDTNDFGEPVRLEDVEELEGFLWEVRVDERWSASCSRQRALV